MQEVIIIGTGNLGKRHVEGVCKSSFIEKIHLVDPCESNREQAANLIRNSKIKIYHHENINGLPKKIDLAIIATNAKERLHLAKELFNKRVINHLILEKVVFNKSIEFNLFDKYIEKLSTKIYINFPRRYVDFYKNLKVIFKNEKNIKFSIYGGNWGLASNFVHFFDIFQYITNDLTTPEIRKFEVLPVSSKRSGYVEFSGEIIFQYQDKLFTAESNFLDSKNHFIKIESDNINVFIDEVGQYAIIKNNGNENKINFTIPYQSDLSKVFIDQIFSLGGCNLPLYKDASISHLIYLKELERIAKNKKFQNLTDVT